MISGDLDNHLIKTINHESILDASGAEIIGPMPPTKQIKPEYIHIFEQWVLAGMPETAEEAAALQSDSTPTEEVPAGDASTSP